MTVGADGETDEGFALLVEWRTRLFWDQGDPVAPDVSENFPDVGTEVDALSVGENFHSSTHPSTAATGSARCVISGATITGCILCGFADGVTGALIRIAEVWACGGGWPGRFD